MHKKSLLFVLGMVLVAALALSACAPAAAPAAEAPAAEAPAAEAPAEEPEPVPSTRKGGWLDEIVYSVIDSDSAITQLEAGAIDIYANGLSSADLPALKESGLPYSTNNGLYYDMLYNPAVFSDGRINPFTSRKIREATNWLFDRSYLNQEIYNGGALEKFFAIQTQGPDYVDLIDVARSLETYYAYDLEKAREVIAA